MGDDSMSEGESKELVSADSADGIPTAVWHRAAVRSAYVAAGFVLVVCLLLIRDYGTRLTTDPLNSEAYCNLRTAVVAEPDNEAAKKRLRAADRQLREDYFRQRRFAVMGTWLALAGCVVLVVSIKAAVTLRRKLPSPPIGQAPRDTDTTQMTLARWSTIGIGAATTVTALTLGLSIRTELPTLTPANDPGVDPLVGARVDPAAGSGFVAVSSDPADNWPRFRGPGGRGVVEAMDLPTSWDVESGEGILWKTPVAMPGNSSPIVWGNRLFLTGADEERRVVMCYDTAGGEMLWQAEIPGTAEVPEVDDDTGYAAPTPVTDGQRVYAIFANGDVGAVDYDGNVVWNVSLGIPDNAYGHASSLAMWQGRVIIQFDQAIQKKQLSKLICLDGATGEEVWSVPRDVGNSWPSPIVIEHEGVAQIITCSVPYVIAHRTEDGSEIWRCECLRNDVGPSPTVCGDMLIVTNEYPHTTAIRLGGEGNITDNEKYVLWIGEDNLPDTCSPLATEKYVYTLAYGYFACTDATNGKFLWEWESEDIYSSSPTMVGDLVYLFGLESCQVLKPGAEGAELVGQGNLGEECVTSPALLDGRMFIRGKEHLFCIGKSARDSQAANQVIAASWPSAEEIAANWPQFRGPGGLGVVGAMDLPTSWDAESGNGILWKTPVEMPGNSSPIVWENRLFLTAADEQRRVVTCYDTIGGKVLWQTQVPGTPQSTAEPPEVAEDTGYAAPTPVTDGQRVYAMFANGDVAAVDYDGKVVWSVSLGMPDNAYGHAASLAMWQDRLIIQFDQASRKEKLSKLICLAGATGEEVWSVPRDVANSWPSPIVIEHEGAAQIITCSDPYVIAYRAEDGTEIWRCNCLRYDVGPSPTVYGDLLIVANEYPQLTAIRLGGEGDITDNEEYVLWIAEDSLPDTCSPLATEKNIYTLASYGYFTCYDAAGGEMLWEWESEDMYTSSPTLVGDLVYLFGLESCQVLRPGEDGAEVVGEGSLGEECVASPAFRDGRLFVRGKEHLFCIGRQ